jgi:hypothetical protein
MIFILADNAREASVLAHKWIDLFGGRTGDFRYVDSDECMRGHNLVTILQADGWLNGAAINPHHQRILNYLDYMVRAKKILLYLTECRL